MLLPLNDGDTINVQTHFLPTRELVEKLQTRTLSCGELTGIYLERIEQVDSQLHSYLSVDPETAKAQADLADAQLGEKKPEAPPAPLLGVPIAIKDNICTVDSKTTCASKILENYTSPYSATVVEKLRNAGAVLLGKVNLDEFAMGSSTENSAFGVTSNPWNREHVPGGSSGGSAAAVAGGLASVALGSDTGGSIRQPAAFCGVVGLKPTYGRVSRYGLGAFASSLDQIGPLSRDVYGVAAVLQAISGHDPRDSTSLCEPVPEYLKTLDQPLAGLRLGFIEEWLAEGVEDCVKQSVTQSVDLFRNLGAEIVPIRLPHSPYCVATYYIIAPSEASSNLSRYDGVHYGYRAKEYASLNDMYRKSRGEGFGSEVKRRIMLGCYALSSGYYDAYYLKAQKVRRLVQQDYFDAFKKVDLLIGPVTPAPAFKKGELVDDPLAMYLADIFTIGANLAGIPAMSIPCGFSENGLPLGVQLLGPTLGEEKLLRAARMFEQEKPWHDNVPTI